MRPKVQDTKEKRIHQWVVKVMTTNTFMITVEVVAPANSNVGTQGLVMLAPVLLDMSFRPMVFHVKT